MKTLIEFAAVVVLFAFSVWLFWEPKRDTPPNHVLQSNGVYWRTIHTNFYSFENGRPCIFHADEFRSRGEAIDNAWDCYRANVRQMEPWKDVK